MTDIAELALLLDSTEIGNDWNEERIARLNILPAGWSKNEFFTTLNDIAFEYDDRNGNDAFISRADEYDYTTWVFHGSLTDLRDAISEYMTYTGAYKDNAEALLNMIPDTAPDGYENAVIRINVRYEA